MYIYIYIKHTHAYYIYIYIFGTRKQICERLFNLAPKSELKWVKRLLGAVQDLCILYVRTCPTCTQYASICTYCMYVQILDLSTLVRT